MNNKVTGLMTSFLLFQTVESSSVSLDNNPVPTTMSSVRNTNVNASCDAPPTKTKHSCFKTKNSFMKHILSTVPENYGGRLDFLSKYLFPFSYLVFNLFYWLYFYFRLAEMPASPGVPSNPDCSPPQERSLYVPTVASKTASRLSLKKVLREMTLVFVAAYYDKMHFFKICSGRR